MSNREIDSAKLVTEYLQARSGQLAEMHDAFDDKPIPPMPVLRVDSMDTLEPWEKTENFLAELKKFNQYMDEVSREVNVGFDVRNCGWSDVLGKMKDANSAIARRMERDKTLWTKGAMVLTDISNLLQPALQAIPDELHLLHGGLALIFHLAKSRTKSKRDIIDTFEEVISSLAAAGNALEDTPEDPRLHDALNRLRLTLLETIPSLINVMMPEKLLSRVAALVKFPTADRLLQVIRTDARRVEMRAKTLGDQLTSEASKITKNHVEEMHDDILGIQDQQQRILDLVRCSLTSQDGLANMFREVVGEFNFNRNRPRTSSGSTIRAHSPSLFSVTTSPVADNQFATLKIILDVPTEHVFRDLNYVRRQEREFDQRSKNTAAAIFTNRIFLRWMNNTQSDLIYLDGRLDKDFGSKTSPISYFCALFAHQLKEGPHSTVTLSFFCGQHVASNDTLRGPRGLLRSLIVQALRVWPLVSLDDPDLASLAGATSHEMVPMEQLCLLFYVIIGQIPPHYTVLCIVDDVNRLERDEWQDDYWLVMRMLEDMVKKGGNEAPFKVMMTSPARSRFLRGDREVQQDHRILVSDTGVQFEPKVRGLRV
ncbi:hypothetical protein QBC39DRAFT_68307 [Podospora conica]|nr:hypothetical protein QBC39DRAFT_68307 [Schizothecium conicum]